MVFDAYAPRGRWMRSSWGAGMEGVGTGAMGSTRPPSQTLVSKTPTLRKRERARMLRMLLDHSTHRPLGRKTVGSPEAYCTVSITWWGITQYE